MTEWDRNYDRTLKDTEYTLRVATTCCNISISYGNLLRCVPWGQWGTSEAPVRQLSPPWVAQPDPPDLPNLRADQQISTDINRFHQDLLWKSLEWCCMPLQSAAAPRCRSVCTWTSWTSELKQRIWLNHLHCVIGTGEVFPETISRSKHMPDFCSKTTYLPTGSLMPLYTFSEAPVPQCGENMTTWLWVLYRASAHTQQRGPSQNKQGSWEGPTSFLMFIQQKEIACKASKCSLLRQSNTKQL